MKHLYKNIGREVALQRGGAKSGIADLTRKPGKEEMYIPYPGTMYIEEISWIEVPVYGTIRWFPKLDPAYDTGRNIAMGSEKPAMRRKHHSSSTFRDVWEDRVADAIVRSGKDENVSEESARALEDLGCVGAGEDGGYMHSNCFHPAANQCMPRSEARRLLTAEIEKIGAKKKEFSKKHNNTLLHLLEAPSGNLPVKSTVNCVWAGPK